MNTNYKKQFLTYLFTAAFEKGTVFVIAPVMVVLLSLTDYGQYALAKTLVVLCSLFISFGIDSFLQVEYIKNDNLWWKKYIAIFVLNYFLLTIGLLLLPRDLLSFSLGEKLFIVSTSFFRSVFLSQLNYFRVFLRSTSYSKYRLASLVLEIGLMILFFVILKDWKIPLLAALISYIVFICFFIYKQNLPKHHLDTSIFKRAYLYGAGVVVHTASTWVISFSDQSIVSKYLGAHELGIYSSVLTLSMASMLFSATFNQFWTPVLFRKLKAGHKEDLSLIRKVNFGFITGVLLTNAAIFILYPQLVQILFQGKISPETISLAKWLIGAYIFNGIYFTAANYLNFEFKTKLVSIASLIAAILNIYLNLKWVPKIGLLGASKATFFSFLTQSGLTYIFLIIILIKGKIGSKYD